MAIRFFKNIFHLAVLISISVTTTGCEDELPGLKGQPLSITCDIDFVDEDGISVLPDLDGYIKAETDILSPDDSKVYFSSSFFKADSHSIHIVVMDFGIHPKKNELDRTYRLDVRFPEELKAFTRDGEILIRFRFNKKREAELLEATFCNTEGTHTGFTDVKFTVPYTTTTDMLQ